MLTPEQEVGLRDGVKRSKRDEFPGFYGDASAIDAALDEIAALRAENERLREVLSDILIGVRHWARDEDGIPEEMIDPYSEGEFVLGWCVKQMAPLDSRSAALDAGKEEG